MGAIGGLGAAVIAGLIVALGLWSGQGWLAVAGMVFLGTAVVVGLAGSRWEGAGQQKVHHDRATAPQGDSTFPAAGLAAVAVAGLLTAVGLWRELSWLTVAGMLLVGGAIVAGLARASSRGRP